MHRGRPTIDPAKATRLLGEGATIRQVAQACGVSTQAIYAAIRDGRVAAPEAEGSAA